MPRIALALSFLVFLTGPAAAEQTTPDLLGVWVSAAGEVGHWSGALERQAPGAATLEVKEQTGGVFRGVMTYRNAEAGPEFEGKEGLGRVLEEPVLGVIDWDGETLIWVDHDDETVHRARLVNATIMEVVAYEPGEFAVVNRMILVRQR